MKRYIYNLIIGIMALAFFACANDDDFSSDKNLSISFSSDIISFDTVFTEIGSATKQFKIYNRNNNSLVIQTIELMNPAESGFRMNIDGESGTKLSNVDILKKDSLFGFIEVTVNPQNTASTVLIRDSIRFSVNGRDLYLQLEAVGQDVYIWKGERITKDSVITNSKPILIYDSMVVNPDVDLTIEKGLTFFMKKGSSLKVHGTLIANGTTSEPILFRTDRFDKIEADIPYNNAPGQWDGIYFYPESFNNNLNNVYVRSATRGMTFYPSGTQQKKADLYNVVVHNTSEYGVVFTNNKVDAYNCLFTNSKGAVLSIYGGQYTFLHCTMANYYRWSARTQASILLSNDKENPTDLEVCDFINTIVYGSIKQEVSLEDSSVLNFRFVNCLLRATESSESSYINTVWNENPLFKDINSDDNYSYNFELKPESPAINKADKSYSKALPFDLNRNSRLEDSNPDIGCYEWK